MVVPLYICKLFFVITEIVCIPTGTSSALRKNRSMRDPIDSLAPRTRFGFANRVGSGSGCDNFSGIIAMV